MSLHVTPWFHRGYSVVARHLLGLHGGYSVSHGEFFFADVVHGVRMIAETVTMMLMNMKTNGLIITVNIVVDDHT